MDDFSVATLAAAAGLGTAQVHVRRVGGGPAWASDDGRWISPASLIKLPLAVAAAQAIVARRLRWSTPVPVAAANLTANDAA